MRAEHIANFVVDSHAALLSFRGTFTLGLVLVYFVILRGESGSLICLLFQTFTSGLSWMLTESKLTLYWIAGQKVRYRGRIGQTSFFRLQLQKMDPIALYLTQSLVFATLQSPAQSYKLSLYCISSHRGLDGNEIVGKSARDTSQI